MNQEIEYILSIVNELGITVEEFCKSIDMYCDENYVIEAYVNFRKKKRKYIVITILLILLTMLAFCYKFDLLNGVIIWKM